MKHAIPRPFGGAGFNGDGVAQIRPNQAPAAASPRGVTDGKIIHRRNLGTSVEQCSTM